jgi:hypothetical protein
MISELGLWLVGTGAFVLGWLACLIVQTVRDISKRNQALTRKWPESD